MSGAYLATSERRLNLVAISYVTIVIVVRLGITIVRGHYRQRMWGYMKIYLQRKRL